MGENWWEAGGDSGAGNGPPMKIAPVGVLYGLDLINLTEMIAACVNISKMTHGDSRAAVAAVAQAYLIGEALKFGSTEQILSEIFNIYKITAQIESFENESLTGKFELMRMCHKDDDMEIRELLGAGAFVNESLPFTYAMILKYKGDIEGCIETLVNMGGDADTNASMAAAILGATYGYKDFPAKWRKGLEDRKRLVNLADDLYYMT